jgi:glycosyltransferase involved in cell wall biosynthesis
VDVALIGTHIAPAKGYGGVPESLASLASTWARQGRSICLCVSDGSVGPRISRSAINLPESVQVFLYQATLFKRWGFGFGALLRVPIACMKGRVVYICGIATWPTTLAALFCMIFGLRYAIAPRGGLMAAHVSVIKMAKPLKWLFYKLLTLPTIRGAAQIHVTSTLERQGVLELVPQANCVIVPNGLNIDDWDAQPADRQRQLRLCYVGRIAREKGINRFARVWLAHRRGGESLVVVGDGAGEYVAQLREIAAGAEGAIEQTGYLSRGDVRAVVGSSDFLVLPSGIEHGDVRENFGNAAAEAFASGRPCLIASGLAWDFIEEEGMGLLFEPTDESIADCIDRARNLSLEAYVAMCTSARNYVERNLNTDVTATQLWSSLTDVC